jgi:hypothetical protein
MRFLALNVFLWISFPSMRDIIFFSTLGDHCRVLLVPYVTFQCQRQLMM